MMTKSGVNGREMKAYKVTFRMAWETLKVIGGHFEGVVNSFRLKVPNSYETE